MVEQSNDGRHLILYDGGCGFCSRLLASVSGSDDKGRFRYVPFGSDEGSKLLAKVGTGDGDPGSVLVFRCTRARPAEPLTKGAAVLFIVGRLRWPWRLLAIARWLPARLLDWGYDHVARSRFMLSGKSESCALPSTVSNPQSKD